MATFTSVTSGNWNDGATWGKTSPGVKGTDWPGLAGDVVNIGTTANQSHVVLYNVSETNELGAVTVGATSGSGASKLEFATGVSTKITLSHVDLLVQATGEVRGQGGAVIPSGKTCELVWHTTSDNAKGINVATGGKFNLSGDPAYYGSKYDYILATQVAIPAATNAVTVTITGNYAANFASGQELLIHKGGNYSGYINDFARLAVISATNNGANTDISCTVTERPAAITCLVGADVLNLSRNVMYYLLSYNANLGQVNGNRPRFLCSGLASGNINVNDAMFGSFYYAINGTGLVFTNVVIRNGTYAVLQANLSTISGIFFSLTTAIGNTYKIILNGYIVGCVNATSGSNAIINASIFGCSAGITGINLSIFGNIYSCSNALLSQTYDCKFYGAIGYDANGVTKANATDCSFAFNSAAQTTAKFINAKTPIPLVYSGRNTIQNSGRAYFEHYGQNAGDHYIADVFGDVYKWPITGQAQGWIGTTPSGAAKCIKVANIQSLIGTSTYSTYLDIITKGLFRVWQKAGTVVYKVYIQAPTANNSNYAAADLVLYADYLDQGSGGHLATANSSGGITKANDWTQSLTVSVTSAADGWVTLYLRLFKYNAAGDVFYVDPGIWADGNILMGDWSYGELVYPGPAYFGGGGNSALLPLGVMEAVA
jgi:hypothetical protein